MLLVLFCGGVNAQLTERERLQDSILMEIDTSYRNIALWYDVQLETLRELEFEVVEVHRNIIAWATERSRADAAHKVETRVFLDDSIPAQIARLKAGFSEMTIRLKPVEEALALYVDNCERIMNLLPDFQSYDDPISAFEAQAIVDAEGELEVSFERLRSELRWTTERVEAARDTEMAMILRVLEMYYDTSKH